MMKDDEVTRDEIEGLQLAGLRALLPRLVRDNPFYRPRVQAAGLGEGLASLDAFRERMPFTTKDELVRDQEVHPPYGTDLSRPLEAYARLHRTSGTTGRSLVWLDTAESWAWCREAWGQVFAGAGITATERVLVAFSFGPFLGLWLGFEAAQELGALVLSGGALDTEGRLRLALEHQASVLCCTPTYALRMGAVAQELGLDLAAGALRKIVVAGEPGGSLPAVRAQIEALFPGARVFDHYGLTEVGPVTFQCRAERDAVHVSETFYLAEVVDPETGAPVEADGEREGELVLTNLGRGDSPVLRYRTGDIVRPLPEGRCACGRSLLRLAGGILARADDMVCVRGVNLYPSAVDQVVRAFGRVAEYRCEVTTERGMSELALQVEPLPHTTGTERAALLRELEHAFRQTWTLRVPVELVEPGTLPRFELKARRWVQR